MKNIALSGKQVPTWVLLVVSGLLLGFAYPPNPVGLFGSIGLVPLLYALERATSWRQFLRWSYCSLFIFSAVTTWWIGSWQAKTDPFLMLSCVLVVLLHPFVFMIPLAAWRAVRRARGRLFALAFLPFFWCAGEYMHALTDLSYPWLTLGNTQTYNLYYIQFIEFTGIWGVSFLLLVQNCAFTAMLYAMDWSDRDRVRVFRTCIAVLMLTLVPPFLYGFYALGKARDVVPARAITITAVQPNVDPWDKWKTVDTSDQVRVNYNLSATALKSLKPDAFLWTETAIPVPLTEPGNERVKLEMQQAVDALGVPVISGFPDYVVYGPSVHPPVTSRTRLQYNAMGQVDTLYHWDYFNSVGLFLPGKGLTGVYHKMQLVPFGERIPFADDVPWLTGLLSWNVGISSWAKGTAIATFSVPYRDTITHAGSVICFESIYPNIVRQFTAAGANFMTVISNDGWYLGTPGPVQHERFAILRAIENRRSIARSANTGVSCFITPYGAVIGEKPQGQALTTTGTIELRDDKTVYVRWGDWFPQLCFVISAIMGAFCFVRVRKRSGALG